MNGSIFLDNVRLYAFHGVAEQERRVGGWFRVSVRIGCDLGKATDSDCVDDTLDYAGVLATVKREMSVPAQLLEHVAGRMARAILSSCDAAETVAVRLAKENPPMGACLDGAGVEVELSRDGDLPQKAV